MSLRLDWCSHEAAKFAVMNWHYSKRMPSGKLASIGVWQDDVFKGAVIYGRGGAQNIGAPFGLDQSKICELVRVALKDCNAATSKIVAISLRMLKRQFPGLQMVVSYADTGQGHAGTIYQASNWAYIGVSKGDTEVLINGKWCHRSRRPSAGRPKRRLSDKHKYAYAFSPALAVRLDALRKPYPKRATSDTIDTPAIHAGKGGEAPTVALHISKSESATT